MHKEKFLTGIKFVKVFQISLLNFMGPEQIQVLLIILLKPLLKNLNPFVEISLLQKMTMFSYKALLVTKGAWAILV
jgi:hypothetical protein